MNIEVVDKYAKIIWNYMHMKQEIKPADIIFVLGSNDLRVADRGAEIFKENLAPLVVCSGGNGKNSDFTETEAKLFSERMIGLGVPKEKIILESNSTNTGENVIFTKNLLENMNIKVKRIIAVQKPYMERRTFATIMKQWLGVECVVNSPQISYEDYADNLDFKNRFINVMVGDLQRIKEYPKMGFQIEQEIPKDVWRAGQELIKLGYTKHIIK
jgi:uncharacterized SAM-binding protein YcdF (DUF218 family)